MEILYFTNPTHDVNYFDRIIMIHNTNASGNKTKYLEFHIDDFRIDQIHTYFRHSMAIKFAQLISSLISSIVAQITRL